jgi:hypothetical protein
MATHSRGHEGASTPYASGNESLFHEPMLVRGLARAFGSESLHRGPGRQRVKGGGTLSIRSQIVDEWTEVPDDASFYPVHLPCVRVAAGVLMRWADSTKE